MTRGEPRATARAGLGPGTLRSRRSAPRLAFAGVLLVAASASADDPSPSFAALLADLRSGRAVDTAALFAAADASAANGRPDAPRIASFYAGLTADERRRGLAAEERYRALFARLAAADRDELVGDAWVREREAIVEGLSRLVEREADAADPLAAGLALGSLASIDVERAIAASPESEERMFWLASAEERARLALAHFERIGAWKPQLASLLVRGRIQRARLAFGPAEETLEACALRARDVGRDDYVRLALEELLGVAEDLDDVYLRERVLRRVAQLAPPSGFRPLIETTADHLIDERQPAAALALLVKHPPPADAEARAHDRYAVFVGNALLRLGRIREAGSSYARVASNPVSRSLAEARLALAERRPAEAIEALDSADPGLFDELALAIADTTRGEAELERGNLDGAVVFLERALAAADAVDERRARDLFDDDRAPTRTTIGEWLGLHTIALLASARAELGEPLEALRVIEESQARSLRAGRASERRLRRLTGERVAPLDLTTAGLCAWAARYELGLVSWVLGADFGVVVWLRPDGTAHVRRVEHARSEIDRARRRFVEALTTGREERADALGAELARALWPDELRAALADDASGSRRLLCLTHGQLDRLPLERLPLGDGRVVDDAATIVVLPGLPEARPAPRQEPPARWIVAGAPVGDDGARLPGAARELATALRQLPGAVDLTGSRFRRAGLERALAGGGNLHVATHLTRAERCAPRRFAPEGLVLSSGEFLCAEEIADLGPRLHLALISACESALGRPVDADGLRGVARAFLESGTRNLVLTLWPVSDEAAEHFATAYHRALRRGLPVDSAARSARAELRAAGRPSADWSAFRFVGRD